MPLPLRRAIWAISFWSGRSSMNQPLALRDFDIRFENGRRQDVNTRARLAAGRCTRDVDLVGGRRDIASVRLRYEPITRTWQRPVVRVQVRG